MRCLLINMDRSPERLTFAIEQFGRLGLALERIAAIDESKLPRQVVAKITHHSASTYKFWAPGMLGCLISHIVAWEAIAAGEDEFVAVFEDDARISPELGGLLRDLSWVPADADVVRIETNFRPQLLGPPIPIGGERSVARMKSYPFGSCAYLMKRSAARRASQAILADYLPPDVSLFDTTRSTVAAGLVAYQVAPAPCVQDRRAVDPMGFGSTIVMPRDAPRAKPRWGLRPIRQRIRRKIARLREKAQSRIRDWQVIPFG